MGYEYELIIDDKVIRRTNNAFKTGITTAMVEDLPLLRQNNDQKVFAMIVTKKDHKQYDKEIDLR
jgi:predicted transcriptional regulator